jgi:hypothetical protein
MARKMVDCRSVPNEVGCTLVIAGEEGELLEAAVAHAVAVHGDEDSPELRQMVREGMVDDAPSQEGAFLQLVEIHSDRMEEIERIQSEWAAEIGHRRRARWSLVGADRDRPDTFVVAVEFPDYDEAMRNSNDPATTRFAEQISKLATAPPQFRNLDVRAVLSG